MEQNVLAGERAGVGIIFQGSSLWWGFAGDTSVHSEPLVLPQGLIQGRLSWAHRQGISTLSPSLSKIIKDFLGTDSLPQPFPTSVFENASMGD